MSSFLFLLLIHMSHGQHFPLGQDRIVQISTVLVRQPLGLNEKRPSS